MWGLSEYPVMRVLADRIHAFSEVSTTVVKRPPQENGLTQLVGLLNSGETPTAALSLHMNAAEGDSPNKAYACHYPGAETSGTLANMLSNVGLRGVERLRPRLRENLAILRDTTFPVVLDEPGYIDRADHQKKMLLSLDSLAQGYAAALSKWMRHFRTAKSG